MVTCDSEPVFFGNTVMINEMKLGILHLLNLIEFMGGSGGSAPMH